MGLYLDEDQVQEIKPNHGLFVVFEGPDGSGKSTLAHMVTEAIRQATTKVYMTREPYFTSIRQWLNEEHTPAAMALVMIGDRIDHLVKAIIPSLNESDIVLSDRYDASTFVYNVVCGDLEEPIANLVCGLQSLLPVPDLYVYAHAPSKVLKERSSNRSEEETQRDDSDMTEGFLGRVSQGYEAFFSTWTDRYGEESVIKVRTDISMEDMSDIAQQIASRILDMWRARKAALHANE